MKNRLTYLFISLVFIGMSLSLQAQYTPQMSDFGKMWPFEYVPAEEFSENYQFQAGGEWLDDVRMAALQFANWCSASFVSPDGLILTNHHCSRMVLERIMKEGEDFDAHGFYAADTADERRTPGLWVRQLVRIMDVSDRVMQAARGAETDEEMISLRDSAIYAVMEEVSEQEDWKNLEIEPVLYYSGVKISLYGYKRYDDIRLVMIPELQAAYFGGDPDNFTYPRYNLDFTLWRAYEDGKPVNSSGFYYAFNPDGIHAGEPIFVVGNPGSTERYRTMAQYEYDRDYRYQIQLDWMKTNYRELEKQFEESGDRMLQEQMFMISNSIKAIQGIIDGLHNEKLMDRKRQMENYIRRQVTDAGGDDYWEQLEREYRKISPEMMEVLLLGPQSGNSGTVLMAYAVDAYLEVLEDEDADTSELRQFREMLPGIAESLSAEEEKTKLANLLVFMKRYADDDDDYVAAILDGDTPDEAADRILKETLFASEKKMKRFLKWDAEKIRKNDDPVILMAMTLVPEYVRSSTIMNGNVNVRRALENKIAREMFGVFGLKLPPDATGTLRISDGRVSGYTYNGTEAPYKTHFFGMYDRYHSFNGEYPWSMPERWLDPPVELLKEPLNFVSTVDIIGGNSGSAMINRNKELVGLVFDGNIESLPGNFIYDEEVNRAVGVHAGGIVAALRHLYGAGRILAELGVE
ncbi:MAG TPA: S46 family peptidase [Bacteroidetes bacterium]|nr:S46 family peptidase [Bacteroidota bacterium]